MDLSILEIVVIVVAAVVGLGIGIGLGIVIGIEATRFYYTTIKPNIETFTKKAST